MNNYTKEDIMKLVEEEDVEFIRLQFTDIFGSLKNMAVTASQLEKALEGRFMFDGSAIEGFASIEDSDLYLKPDPNTLEIFPWRPQQGKVARLICDIVRPDGTPFEGDSRYILRRKWDICSRWDRNANFSCSIWMTTQGPPPSAMSRPDILTSAPSIWEKMRGAILC